VHVCLLCVPPLSQRQKLLMFAISIHSSLKAAVSRLALGCISANVTVEKYNGELWREIDQHLSHLTATIKPDQTNTVPQIAAMRSAYKTLGKDPSRYRGSAEALLRRVLAGKGLYQINNIVDINNLVSLETFQPLGSYDLERIDGPVELRIGMPGETYKGIGKDEINIENLPVFADAQGPFGSPTSDSERAMVRLETCRILMVIFSFAGPDGLESSVARACELLGKYAAGQAIESSVVV
jgi:DNA/RNA-binding domain of Phe-tRNA-synthetase-like protein